MNVRGRIHDVAQTKTFGAKSFQSRVIVVDTGGSYGNLIPIELSGDMLSGSDELQIGQLVDVVIPLSGRAWQRDQQSETKYLLTARARSLQIDGDASTPEVEHYAPASGGEVDVPF